MRASPALPQPAGAWAAPAGAARPATRAADPYANRYWIAFGVILGAVMELIDTSIVNVALSDMSANLGVSLDEITWVVVGYIVAAVIILPMTGWLAAVFGRKRYFLWSTAIFTVASFMCGTAGSLGTLVFWRIVQGLGGGALIATAQAILFEAFPPAQKTLASAIFGLGMITGPAIGPTLGGVIVNRFSWPWIFHINVPFGVLSMLVVAAFVRDPEHPAPAGRIDLVGIALLAIGIGALQFVLERGEHYDWFDSPLILWLTVLSVFALATMVVWELTTPEPVLDLRVLKDRSLAAGSAFAIGLGFVLYGAVIMESLFMQTALRWDAETVGWLLLPGALAAGVCMLALARLGTRLDVRWTIAAGATLMVAAMWQHAHLTLESGQRDWFWTIVWRGAGSGLMFVPLTAAAVSNLKGHALGHGSAIFNLTRQLGGSIGIALLSTFLVRETASNRAVLVEHTSAYSVATQQRLALLGAGMAARGVDPATARARATQVLDGAVQAQARVIAFEDTFLVVGLVIAASLPLVLLLRRPTAMELPSH